MNDKVTKKLQILQNFAVIILTCLLKTSIQSSGFTTKNTNKIHQNTISQLVSLPIPRINGTSTSGSEGRPPFILFSGSIDQSIGRWNEFLEQEVRFEGQSASRYTKTTVFVEEVAEGDNHFPAFQVLNLKAQVYNSKGYIVANLGGSVLRILSLKLLLENGVTADEFQFVKDISISRGILRNGYDLVKDTNYLILGSENQLLKYQFDLEGDSPIESVIIESDNRRIRFKWISIIEIGDMNSNGGTRKLIGDIQLGLVSLREISNMENVVSSSENFSGSPLKLFSLKGIFNAEDKDEDILKRQQECAITMTSSVKITIRDCYNLEVVKREYGKIHGFYEIEGFQVVKGTPLIFTSGGDKRLALWDITNSNPVPPVVSENTYERTPVTLLYEPKLAKIFLGFYHPIVTHQDTPRPDPYTTIISHSTCLIDDCIHCPDSPNRCLTCKEGYVNIGNTQCLDCSNTDAGVADLQCSEIRRPWALMRIDPMNIAGAGGSRNDRDGGGNLIDDDFGRKFSLGQSSAVFKLIVNDIEFWKPRLRAKSIGGNLHSKFTFYIEDVNRNTYNYTYAIHDSDIYLAMNFTSDFNNKKMLFSLLDPVLITADYSFINPTQGTTQQGSSISSKPLILINRTQEIFVSGRETINEDTLKTFGTIGKTAGVITTLTAGVTGLLAGFSICFPFGIGAFILSFFQVIEIISRLSYINVNFGLILTALLEGLDGALGLPEISLGTLFDYDAIKHFRDFRGKLTYYEVSPIVLSTIPFFSVFYILIWIFYLIVIQILKKKAIVTPNNLLFVKKILNLRFMIYGMGVLEFALYSAHGITHHTEIFDSFLSIFSYLIAFTSFCLAVFETLKIIDFARKVFYSEDIVGIDGLKFLSNSDGKSMGIEGIDNSILAIMGFRDIQAFRSYENSRSKSRSSSDKVFFLIK